MCSCASKSEKTEAGPQRPECFCLASTIRHSQRPCRSNVERKRVRREIQKLCLQHLWMRPIGWWEAFVFRGKGRREPGLVACWGVGSFCCIICVLLLLVLVLWLFCLCVFHFFLSLFLPDISCRTSCAYIYVCSFVFFYIKGRFLGFFFFGMCFFLYIFWLRFVFFLYRFLLLFFFLEVSATSRDST